MKNSKWIWCMLLSSLLFIILTPIAYGDLYVEYTVESGGGVPDSIKNMPKQVQDQMMKQFEPKTETVRSYFSPYGSRTETKDGIMIMVFGTMTMYQLNPADKTYTKVDIKAEMEGSLGEMAKEIAAESKMTPTDEKKEIAGYNCRKYILTMMGTENEHWLSKEVEGYEEYKAIGDKMLQKNPNLGQMSVVGLAGEEGFLVKKVDKMMGMTTTTTLKKIEKRSLSKDLFRVPAEYKLLEIKIPIQ